jgi:hypothetical protein
MEQGKVDHGLGLDLNGLEHLIAFRNIASASARFPLSAIVVPRFNQAPPYPSGSTSIHFLRWEKRTRFTARRSTQNTNGLSIPPGVPNLNAQTNNGTDQQQQQTGTAGSASTGGSASASGSSSNPIQIDTSDQTVSRAKAAAALTFMSSGGTKEQWEAYQSTGQLPQGM